MTKLDQLLAHGIVPDKCFHGVASHWYLPILVCFTYYSHVTQLTLQENQPNVTGCD